MSEHTPEPWIYDSGDGLIYEAFTPDRQECCPIEISHEPNARRIVACVNACTGMADPAAEIARLRADNDEIDEVCTRRQLEIYNLRAEIAKLRAEREELIKAGNVMRRFIMSWRDCLEGVQMSEEDFVCDCGIGRWNDAALAEKGE